MDDVISELKHRARRLQRLCASGDPEALARVAAARSRRDPVPESLRRRDCLNALAREVGFANWPQARAALRGVPAADFGDLLYPPECSAHWNLWCANYAEAQTLRAETGGYLLPYRMQFFVADEHFIRTLGLNPQDPDWTRMGHDWARPQDRAARTRLTQQLVALRSRAVG